MGYLNLQWMLNKLYCMEGWCTWQAGICTVFQWPQYTVNPGSFRSDTFNTLPSVRIAFRWAQNLRTANLFLQEVLFQDVKVTFLRFVITELNRMLSTLTEQRRVGTANRQFNMPWRFHGWQVTGNCAFGAGRPLHSPNGTKIACR